MLGWLASVDGFADSTDYSRHCYRFDPPLQPIRQIEDHLAEVHRRAKGSPLERRQRLDADRREARFYLTLASSLLADGDEQWHTFVPTLKWVTLELDRTVSARMPAWKRESLLEGVARAREQAIILIEQIDLHVRARAAIEQRYFAGRPLLFARAREGVGWIDSGVEVLKMMLERSPGDVPPPSVRRATPAAVESRVREQILDAQIEVARKLDGPEAAIPLIRQRLLPAEELARDWWQ